MASIAFIAPTREPWPTSIPGGCITPGFGDFLPDSCYSIGILGGFGMARHNGIMILSLGISKEGPEGPYCVPVSKLAKPGQWAGIKAKPPRETTWSYSELACGIG
eukprot:2240597-Heterocapsa_arctica.AAC.1